MARRRRTRRSTAPARHAQFAAAVPFVMAHRIARMMQPSPSARDRAELSRMVSEKAIALQESWLAMGQEMLHIQYRLGGAWWMAVLGMLGKGWAPIQRRAIANARRLAR